MGETEVRFGIDGRARWVEVGVCSVCLDRPPARGEVLCEPCLMPREERRRWSEERWTAEERATLQATRRWVEAEAPVTSPAEAYRSLLARRECP